VLAVVIILNVESADALLGTTARPVILNAAAASLLALPAIVKYV
jgi:hypothetical protein